MELIFVRHALPVRTVNEDGSAADPVLDELGHHQAREVAAWLADSAEGRIHAVIASPMRRAHQTAVPIAAALGLPISFDEDFAEYDRHAAEYIPVEELRKAKDDRWFELLEGRWGTGVEPVEFQARIVQATERVIAGHRGQRVVIVCHGGVINAYAASVADSSKIAGFFHPDYTSIHRFMAASSGERSVLRLNEVSHLRGKGLLP